MNGIIGHLGRAERRRLKRLVRSTDRDESRRALGVLRVAEGCSVSEVARYLEAARSSLYRWLRWYALAGEAGLARRRTGRKTTVFDVELLASLDKLISTTPREHGYLASRWSSEMLAHALKHLHARTPSASTLRRWLPQQGYGWRRARPTLHNKDPQKAEKLAAIEQALRGRDVATEVFYVDEVDIDLNPKIGFCWSRRGRQTAIPTPGQNKKRYLAGALHAQTGKVVWVEGESKSSGLFIELLAKLRATYRRARRIVLIVDNYIIHKSRQTRQWLVDEGKKIELLFQPVYHPWVNRIERLWKALHDTVTRNHRYPDMAALMESVEWFMHAVQPFPGAGHGLRRVADL